MVISRLILYQIFVGLNIFSIGVSSQLTQFLHPNHTHHDHHWKSAVSDYLRFYRDSLLNRQYNDWPYYIDGSDMPPNANAQTMLGQRRLDELSSHIMQIASEGIEGHIIETGVWKGGASFYAAKVLELIGESNRLVYMCDTFSGIPPPPSDKEPNGKPLDFNDKNGHNVKIMNENSEKAVRKQAERFNLNVTAQLRFVKGIFKDTLPALINSDPDLRFAIVRLDGDTYYSTYDAISNLYPRLNDGGILIVDDYMDWQGCRDAIHDYRTQNNITDEIFVVPHPPYHAEYSRGVYWRKNGAKLTKCVGASKDVQKFPLPRDIYLPPYEFSVPKGGHPNLHAGLIDSSKQTDVKMCLFTNEFWPPPKK